MASAALPRPAPALSPKARLRLLWLKIHRWMGLTLLVVMFAFGFTGSVLVWPDALDRLINPARHTGAATAQFTPDEAFLARARAALPAGDRISGLRVSGGQGAILVAGQVSSKAPLDLGPPGRIQLWMHPQTGAVLDTQNGNLSFNWAMHAIHGHLLLRDAGRAAVAIAGLFLLATSIIGIWLWWPGRRNLLKALKWRKQFSISMNLHRQTGAVLALVMIVEAITGAWIALPRLFEAMIEPGGSSGRVVSEGPPPAPPLADPALPIERAVAIARGAAGSAAPIVTIFTPSENNPVWKVSFADGAVSVNDMTGAATPQQAPVLGRAARVTDTVEAIHAGDMGPVWQVTVFLSGIILCLLSVTGLLLWLQGRAFRNRRKSRA